MTDLCVRYRGHVLTLLLSLDQVCDVLETSASAVGVGECMAAPTATGQVTVIGHFWDPVTA